MNYSKLIPQLIVALTILPALHAQNVGIGELAPKASLHLYNPAVGKGNVLFEGLQKISNPGDPPISGAGTRTFWYSDKAAFRSGVVTGTQWDKDNIGQQSMAWGRNTISSGFGATAWGNGNECSASFSTAWGVDTRATNFSATAWGRNTTSSGQQSTAWGYLANATGDYSTAAGFIVESAGAHSVALGSKVGANGTGSFIFGDSDPNNKGKRTSISNNLFWSRFNGGYYLVSSDAGVDDIGVRLLAGGNSWTTISDKNLKENFEPIDGEALLARLSDIPQYTWNYKGQDPKTFRHYGPMAQDFYKAFGKDDHGTIGCDTLINQHDFIGVNMVAIQALEKRTTEMQLAYDKKINALETALQMITKKYEELIAPQQP